MLKEKAVNGDVERLSRRNPGVCFSNLEILTFSFAEDDIKVSITGESILELKCKTYRDSGYDIPETISFRKSMKISLDSFMELKSIAKIWIELARSLQKQFIKVIRYDFTYKTTVHVRSHSEANYITFLNTFYCEGYGEFLKNNDNQWEKNLDTALHFGIPKLIPRS